MGAVIAANKSPGIRTAVCHDTYCAHQCVEHDDVNLLAMGAWIIGIKVAQEIIDTFLAAEFSTDPGFLRRVQKLPRLKRLKPVSSVLLHSLARVAHSVQAEGLVCKTEVGS